MHEANWTTEVESRLRKFEKRIIFALKNEGWDGKESNDTVTWTFAGGLFYSITVITTIGTIKQNTKTAKLPFEMIFFFFRLWSYCSKDSLGKNRYYILRNFGHTSYSIVLV